MGKEKEFSVDGELEVHSQALLAKGDHITLEDIICPLIKDYRVNNLISMGTAEDTSQTSFTGSRVGDQQSRGGCSSFGKRSVVKAIHKLERRLRRSKRKIKKKKLLAEFGIKTDKVSRRNKMIPASSLSSGDIRNRNSLLFKKAREMMDVGARLGIHFKGGRNFMLKTLVEMQEAELAERIDALDDLENEFDLEDDVDPEDDASLSLEL
ncbi:hypothetical protein RHGRI_010677 [Rhododendron griersonianum]|nr:hypothetical protein RHGRI_010677 [Rhododendron griersonianum]